MYEFELPDIGEGITEGEVVAWHVEPGDSLTEDQVLVEVETDKAVVELPTAVAGTVRDLHAEVGDVVPVGDVLVTVDGDDDEDGPGPGAEPTVGDRRVFAPPSVRRLARELGVDITALDGSEPGGRVTEAAVRQAANDTTSDDRTVDAPNTSPDGAEVHDPEAGSGEGQNESAPAGRVTEAADRERTLAVPATRRIASELDVDTDKVPTDRTREGEPFVTEAEVRAFAERETGTVPEAAHTETGTEPSTTEDRVSREPYSGIRRTIGERMAESADRIPHATHHDTAVVPDLVDVRERLASRAAKRDVPLTYVPFVLKATVAGLEEHPILNATLDEASDEIVFRHYYDLGVAVATDHGLVVPVIEQVDELGLLDLAAELDDLVTRARDRALDPAELQGSTFSITNFGAIGGEYAAPIINYPEAGILGLGTIERRPVVVEGEVVARHTLPLSLSIDHRVIDGAEGARFVNTVKEYLENPTLLMLE